MDLGIEGKVALVTGASKGLGFGVAQALAQEGAKVAISSRSRERIEEAAGSIGATPFVHDASDVDHATDLVRRVDEDLGPIDILIANSGGPPASPHALSVSHAQRRGAYEPPLLRSPAVVGARPPRMRGRGWGPVGALSSTAVAEAGPAPGCSP